jgi:hypothetical protein
LNGDGFIDVAVANSNEVSVLFGNGDGTLQTPQTFAAGDHPRAVTVADLNGDGALDLLVLSDAGAGILLGDGVGGFGDPTSFPAGMIPTSVVIGDFNGDDKSDLAVADYGDPHTGDGEGLSILLGNGDGTFQPASSVLVGRYPSSVAVADFNGDGVQDLAVIDVARLGGVPTTCASVLLGNGDGSFQAPLDQPAGPTALTLVASEVTGDTAIDLVVISSPYNPYESLRGSAVVLSGNGDGTFQTSPNHYLVGLQPRGIAAGDFNDDGASDLAVANEGSDDISILLGETQSTTVTINQAAGQSDPTAGPSVAFDVAFSGPVTGFDASDISLSASTVRGTLMPTVSGSGRQFTVTITGMTGQGTIVASIPAAAAIDAFGRPTAASTSTDNSITFDAVPPTVTIDQAVGQADPTNIASIQFDVKFSEPVTGFNAADVSLVGSTVAGNLSITVTGSLDTYIVTVSGMTASGVTVASIPAGGAVDAAGNANLDFTSSDNSVEFVSPGTIGFSQAIYRTSEDAVNHVVTITVTRVGAAGGALSVDYSTSDGSAHAGSDYTPTSGTLNWADGELGDKTFEIPILDDTLNEGEEFIHLTLTNPIGIPALGLTTATVAIAPSDPQGSGTYFDQDGDKYTIKLAGKTGSLLYYRTDPDGDGKGPIELIELTGTLPDPLKPKASLAITVRKSKTSTDGGTVGLGAISGTGLRSISARKVNLTGDGIDLNGYLGALTIGNILNGADVTTLTTTNPKQKTRISALAIGDGTTLNIVANVSSLTATSFGASSLTAPSVGTFRVKGAVTGADIEVGGNVEAVVVGAFRDSRLLAGYSGSDVPDSTGFNFAATVTTFRSTGKIDGFANSQVIATSFKSVTLASLDSVGSAGKFGFYAHTSLGAINVIGPAKFKYTAGQPTPCGVGDFEVAIV